MNEVLVEELRQLPVSRHQIEIVERKGIGHPDSICDGIMEAISQALSRQYLERFGSILHHNIDKALLVAGQVERTFGGGRVIRPMELIIGDRATFSAGGVQIPVQEICLETAKTWFRQHLRYVDPESHVNYRVVLAPGSEELRAIFDRREGTLPGSNDTSAAVGYAPLSPTETAVLEMEKHLNSPTFKSMFPETGEDVKVMGFRRQGTLHLTIAMPLLAPLVDSESAYFRKKEEILAELHGLKIADSFEAMTCSLNTLDRQGHGLEGVYLSLLGTSAEDADSGQVGRGNRVNGLIPLSRPASGEAAAGKNPVSHVGKIYNVFSHYLAAKIHDRIDGLQEVYVWLLGEIGRPVNEPQVAVQLVLDEGRDFQGLTADVI
ncbi:MAG: methionine adenosyltransferase [Candidatus Tectomicrobia bacterium]|uniref:Methionine adenosyltransferase n=1 Tax=Tectimicrobiota bacterium TaxID=2528274 RepID=A0A932GRF3_UNCTE|nr:methionine adenosyltransferase [Candidatus Tectomicrobia bacterium]